MWVYGYFDQFFYASKTPKNVAGSSSSKYCLSLDKHYRLLINSEGVICMWTDAAMRLYFIDKMHLCSSPELLEWSGLQFLIGAVIPEYCAVFSCVQCVQDLTLYPKHQTSDLTSQFTAWWHTACFSRSLSHFNALSLSISVQVFHDIAYKAKDRQDLLAGIDEFLDEVIVLPPGEWDPTIRIEPPKSLPSSDKRSGPHF